jgi:HSP20 family molecular chaperone IbpA
MTQTLERNAVATRPGPAPHPSGGVYVPRGDIVETDDEFILYADLPGVKSEDVSLQLKEGELVIHGRCAPRHAGKRALYAEYGVGDFHRTFRVTEQIDADRIDAAVMDGVLAVRLPKAETAKPKRIAVKGG